MKRRQMSDAEIRRHFLKYRYEPVPWVKREFPLRSVLTAAGVPDMNGRLAVNMIEDGYVFKRYREQLSETLHDIDDGKLTIRKVWTGGGSKVTIDRHEPAGSPIVVEKLTLSSAWKPFAVCRSCGGRRWHSIAIRDGFHYACQSCVPDWQWPAMGARRATRKERDLLPETTIREDFGVDIP